MTDRKEFEAASRFRNWSLKRSARCVLISVLPYLQRPARMILRRCGTAMADL